MPEYPRTPRSLEEHIALEARQNSGLTRSVRSISGENFPPTPPAPPERPQNVETSEAAKNVWRAPNILESVNQHAILSFTEQAHDRQTQERQAEESLHQIAALCREMLSTPQVREAYQQGGRYETFNLDKLITRSHGYASDYENRDVPSIKVDGGDPRGQPLLEIRVDTANPDRNRIFSINYQGSITGEYSGAYFGVRQFKSMAELVGRVLVAAKWPQESRYDAIRRPGMNLDAEKFSILHSRFPNRTWSFPLSGESRVVAERLFKNFYGSTDLQQFSTEPRVRQRELAEITDKTYTYCVEILNAIVDRQAYGQKIGSFNVYSNFKHGRTDDGGFFYVTLGSRGNEFVLKIDIDRTKKQPFEIESHLGREGFPVRHFGLAEFKDFIGSLGEELTRGARALGVEAISPTASEDAIEDMSAFAVEDDDGDATPPPSSRPSGARRSLPQAPVRGLEPERLRSLVPKKAELERGVYTQRPTRQTPEFPQLPPQPTRRPSRDRDRGGR